jgi:hypothetical protein
MIKSKVKIKTQPSPTTGRQPLLGGTLSPTSLILSAWLALERYGRRGPGQAQPAR